MIDISKQSVKLKCPECMRSVSLTIKQVADEELIKCTCGLELQLRDSNRTNEKAIRDINKAFKDLENTFKN
ncbi:MAG: hypothetical protein RI943_626 [Bacteroidota bacterium]|jgi:hypothetical protein